MVTDGVFHAGDTTGTVVITVRAVIDSVEIFTDFTVTVTDNITDFEVTAESDAVKFGGDLSFDFKAFYLTNEIHAASKSFEITCDSGYVDESGVFHHDGVSYKDVVTVIIKHGGTIQYLSLDVIGVPFADVENHWAKEYIARVYDYKLINGEISSGIAYYHPERFITRSEFAKIIAVYAGLEIAAKSEAETWDAPYIKAVTDANLMKGKSYPDGHTDFDGGSLITRAELMFVLSNFVINGTDSDGAADESLVTRFTDGADVPEWALAGIERDLRAGLAQGYTDNTLRPNATVTRAEAAVFFSHLFDIS
jgi:hypothetical protein